MVYVRDKNMIKKIKKKTNSIRILIICNTKLATHHIAIFKIRLDGVYKRIRDQKMNINI